MFEAIGPDELLLAELQQSNDAVKADALAVLPVANFGTRFSSGSVATAFLDFGTQ